MHSISFVRAWRFGVSRPTPSLYQRAKSPGNVLSIYLELSIHAILPAIIRSYLLAHITLIKYYELSILALPTGDYLKLSTRSLSLSGCGLTAMSGWY